MSEWDRADANGMEMVNSAQYHHGLDQLWGALTDGDENFDTRGLDVYSLAAEAIEERNALRAQRNALRAQKRDLEYRLEAQKETNREICAIDDVGRISHDLEVANGHIEYYRKYTQGLLEERSMLRRALVMIRRISRLVSTPWFSPCKLIDDLVHGTFTGEYYD